MATQTQNLGLTKPAYSDPADVQVFNGNMDILDAYAGELLLTLEELNNALGDIETALASI